jgi:hypothetical protein
VLRLSAQGSSHGDGSSSSTAAIRNLAVTPTSIHAHAATRVLVTAQIRNPGLIPGSISLIRLDSSGTPIVIGKLHDDGRDGDAVAGDGIYSAQITLNEPAAGLVGLKVSVSVQGVLKRFLCDMPTVTVAPRER